MQEAARTNRDRTERTRAALLQAARALFVAKGYADTSTPEIVAAAGITRGALYHHFDDKKALFRAVVAAEAEAVAHDIEQRAAPVKASPVNALLAGGVAYLDAMAVPGRTRLLLIEGPSVLGVAEIRALDDDTAARTLREGLQAAIGSSAQLPALADLLSAAFDRAALAIEAGADAKPYHAAIALVIKRLVQSA
ncbi:TetR/AcrR family transcriptional regulator [Bradyrhizobium sp. U87765 SZCCT0131]|uniref:TetR/AcrR family transcriptional regulator n=1 Tax=unclassified Bradyrhizobium TaxID=2631580 RepID=UPI001BA983B4|nr:MULTISPECIES: TetR/AcrR family transcriptional regulator [unclassified Bradyrhizobium]MBR1221381.1 TetR/AcrR family transcriptional regulator [Bradyrhizobium sp. U87765 SZCCT0131]MBR1264696.1 TetR/AcrR family transcriptional regulator [Bradyrhizobium sp. U87765 SZCCT0134]MBR1304398.1 TetR/AcrR family transcriptional regulator [Bradyrhizobium sp. U87765 SZCCT0110]MBR1322745.1 TetR/AcrR family transcriptional regulator [Bradyrhizobium sp. U87765 SZCCT0109]MBR1346327.1 TetR/AcrR family transcr